MVVLHRGRDVAQGLDPVGRRLRVAI